MSVNSAMLVYMLVTMFTPGPNNLNMMYLAARTGFRGTRKFLTASGLSLLTKCLLCGALNVALAAFIPALVKYLKWLGAAYMLYLAFVMARSGWQEEQEGQEKGGSYSAGVILQLLNMKSWVSCLSLFAVYVVPYSQSFLLIALISVVYFLIMLIASATWGLFGSAMRRFVSRYKKPFGLVMAASLVYCAVMAIL